MYEATLKLQYEIGENVFTTRNEKQIEDCPMCKGDGKVGWRKPDTDKLEYEVFQCPRCKGSGKAYVGKKLVVSPEVHKIVGIRVVLLENGSTNVTYRVTNECSTFDRPEEKVFATLEDAERYCDIVNNGEIGIMVNIDDIKINNNYNKSHPTPAKVAKKIAEYEETNKLQPIEVNKDMELVDGYITYKIAKMFNIEEVEIKVVE